MSQRYGNDGDNEDAPVKGKFDASFTTSLPKPAPKLLPSGVL